MSEFDRDCITYTQEGRILQIQYAVKAVENSETTIGIKCKDGVILGAQKLLFSKLLVDSTHRRIYNVDKHIGMALGGKIPDGRHIMNYARNQSAKFYKDYDITINGRTLCDRLSLYLNAYTLASSVRPFGSNEIIASYTKDQGFGLYMLEPSGNYFGYTCCTSGKGRQTAKAQFQKRDFLKMTCKQALFYMAKMLIKTHEQSREKKYQYEISWITEQTGYIHQNVPKQLIQDAVEKATAAIQQQQMG